MDPQAPQNNSTATLEDKFRIEDHAIHLLIRKLEAQAIEPAYVGHIAHKVLEIVSQAYSRAQMVDLIKHAETEYPELHLITEQETVYVKEQAEGIIKHTVEELVAQKQIDAALTLAKTITGGTIPPELQEKIDQV